MKQIPNTVGGWMWFVEKVKECVSRELNEQDYSDMMQHYINGSTWLAAAEALPLEARQKPPEKKKR